MELNVNDYNDAVKEWCTMLLESHYNLAFLTKDFSRSMVRDKRAVIDRNLVRMNLCAQNMIDLVFPVPEAGEIHGLPKEATSAADAPNVLVAHRDRPQWDFKPWFAEKSGALKKAVHSLTKELEIGFDSSAGTHLSQEKGDSLVGSMVALSMGEIEGKSKALLDMIESGKLIIKDVRLEQEY